LNLAFSEKVTPITGWPGKASSLLNLAAQQLELLDRLGFIGDCRLQKPSRQ